MIILPGFVLCSGGMVEFIQSPKKMVGEIDLVSDAFSQGGEIPPEYTCKGKNISPGLSWDTVPKGTESLILIMDDPNRMGETVSHWVMYNIPPGKRTLPPSQPQIRTLPDDSLQGVNDFQKTGYVGPCPKEGERHQYHFHLYAIDMMLYPTHPLPHTVNREALLMIIEGHVLAYGELVGYFQT